MLDPNRLPEDLLRFDRYYLGRDDAAFFAALSADGQVLGSIAVLPYENRIMELKGNLRWKPYGGIGEMLRGCRAKEAESGASLVKEALTFCLNKHYATAYLHTHRFLPGAVSFWQHHGFVMRGEMNDELQTVHMDRAIP